MINTWNFYDTKRKYAHAATTEPLRERRALLHRQQLRGERHQTAGPGSEEFPVLREPRCRSSRCHRLLTGGQPQGTGPLTRANGWRRSCSGFLATRIIRQPSVTSCPTSGRNKPTRINLTKRGPA